MTQHGAKVPLELLRLGQLPCSVGFIATLCDSLLIMKMHA